MTTTATPHTTRSRPPANKTTPTTPPPIIGSLCTGIAGLDLGVAAAVGGARLSWVADTDPDATRFLAHRFPGAPNLGDMAGVAWDRLQPVDIITAGVPCQDISSSGPGGGIEKGTRSSVWKHIILAVRLLRPRLLIVENVAALRWRNRGLATVLGDLARARYDAKWCSLRADTHSAHLAAASACSLLPTPVASDATRGPSRLAPRRGRVRPNLTDLAHLGLDRRDLHQTGAHHLAGKTTNPPSSDGR